MGIRDGTVWYRWVTVAWHGKEWNLKECRIGKDDASMHIWLQVFMVEIKLNKIKSNQIKEKGNWSDRKEGHKLTQ